MVASRAHQFALVERASLILQHSWHIEFEDVRAGTRLLKRTPSQFLEQNKKHVCSCRDKTGTAFRNFFTAEYPIAEYTIRKEKP